MFVVRALHARLHPRKRPRTLKGTQRLLCTHTRREALDALEFYRSGDGIESTCTGHAGTWEGLQIQLDVM